MKTILFLAVIGVAGYYGYKHLYKPGGNATSTNTGSGDAFLAGCRNVSKKIPKVDEYCACLQQRGVKSMLMLGAKPAGREAIAACQGQVGYTAPTPGLNPE